MEDNNEISLQEIVLILWEKLGLIVLCTVIGGLIAYGISSYIIAPTYTSRISMYVNNSRNSESTVANINDINASQKLVSTYIEILKSDNILKQVSEKLDGAYTSRQIYNMMQASSINGTEIFEVKITAQDPEEAAYIANTIAEVIPSEIIRVVKAGSVELIDKAVPASAASAPHIPLNTVIGMMLGAVLSVLIVLVLAMLDNRVKDEEDIKRHYSLPVLGNIPDLQAAQSRIK